MKRAVNLMCFIKVLLMCNIIICFSVLFLMIECGVFGGCYHEYFEQKEPGIWFDVGELSWAFALGVTSCVLTFISLALLVVDLLTGEEWDDIKS